MPSLSDNEIQNAFVHDVGRLGKHGLVPLP